ncbi:hypothetical protein SAMN05660642_00673 [Geodermatophilus siccatus]|uniref:Uncharacterized protein n=1 Tax=Geodermatophilus siccatus TaxID=1137991 RepID=A0A1G9MJM2_9ACTN|nr:hypothetical protein [Geodermatophilus siccatus]SDL74486.1 hypothetical protein SAMN05660642_00673 [Geodermatophilus siccatus]
MPSAVTVSVGDEPLAPGLVGRRAAHPHLRGIQQAELPARPQVDDHIGQGPQPEPALDGAAALGRQWGTSPTAR